jgi:hypothetical protein
MKNILVNIKYYLLYTYKYVLGITSSSGLFLRQLPYILRILLILVKNKELLNKVDEVRWNDEELFVFNEQIQKDILLYALFKQIFLQRQPIKQVKKDLATLKKVLKS